MVCPSVALARTACALAALGLAPVVCAAAPVLRSAEARITMRAPGLCDVSLTLEVDDATRVEHRLEVLEGSRIDRLEVRGGTVVGDLRAVGPTRVLVVAPSETTYSLRYAVQQPEHEAYRCPLWLPAVAADGRSRNVRILVSLPDTATAAGTLPRFEWRGAQGTATLGHLPSFVRVPYAMPGEPAPVDVARVMDIVAVAAMLGASAAWVWRRKT
ncbi:MAG: hypothetical protein OEW19_06815 [Acidobacteriota bacterium]|nr:hypothetical protein [Acidobacteriota bacterium]